jgi:hypothetical protein
MEPSDKLLRRIAGLLGDVVDDIDEDDLKEAINEAMDLNEIVKDLIDEDEGIKDALKKKVKKLLIEEINNINDGDDMDNYLEGSTTWSDVTEGIFDITEILKEAVDDEKIQKELKTKSLELMESRIEDLSEDDLPNGIWDKDTVASRIKIIMADPNFLEGFIEAFDKSLKKIVVSMAKNGDYSLEKTVKEHPQVLAMIQNRIEDMMKDSIFLDDLRKALMVKVSETPDLQKALLNMMFGRMAEHLVDMMFNRI